MIFEYIGAAFLGIACCVKGTTMGGRSPCPPRPTKFANGVRALRPPVFTKFARPPRPYPPRLPPPHPVVLNEAILGMENCVIGGCIVGAGW